MPSKQHEMLIELFRHRPSLAAEVLTDALGMELPRYRQARLESAELNDIAPTEYRADAVVVLAADRPVLAVVIEAQLRRDRLKRWSWPVYLSTLRARLRCPTVLLIVCVNDGVAGWCAAPIPMGHAGWELAPLVLGPDRVPVVTDTDQARHAPELAVLSALTHGGGAGGEKVLDALWAGLESLDPRRVTLYSDVVSAALPVAARTYLEGLLATRMYEYQSEFVLRYVLQGRAEGIAAGRTQATAACVINILEARGIRVPDNARLRILHCQDDNQLELWVECAATVDSLEELFED